jgi:hypothetical protein
VSHVKGRNEPRVERRKRWREASIAQAEKMLGGMRYWRRRLRFGKKGGGK